MAVDTQVVWQDGAVVECEDVADDVRRIVLAPERPRHARPGTHVDLLLPVDGRTLSRSYSVVRSEADGSRLTLSVQLAATSRGGSRFMHELSPGDTVRMTQPLQNFPLGVGARRYLLLAGGIGVTALVAAADALRRRGADYRFAFVGRSRSVMAYLDELAEVHGDRLTAYVDDEGTALDTGALLDEVAASDHARDTEVYVCGPIRLMDAVRRGWAERGLPPTHLRFETFGNSGSWAAEDFVVRIPALDREVLVDAHTSMLDALEGAGVPVMADCRKGECGLCTVSVRAVSGRVDHRDVFLSERQQDEGRQMCCCVSRVAGQGSPAVLTIDRP